MKVTYTENPLEIIVELDDKDRKILGLGIRIDRLEDYYEETLKSSHSGDCTCIPCTCSKCYAEMMLGIDTLSLEESGVLGKYEGAVVASVFARDNINTCEDAIKHLEQHKIAATEEWHKDHISRWQQEQDNALQWLKEYQKTFLNQ